MKITAVEDKFALEVSQNELNAIIYVLEFCLGGIDDDKEVTVIKLIGQYESFIEGGK